MTSTKFFAVTIPAMLVTCFVGWAQAAEVKPAPKAPRCTMIVINGDTVIKCPTIVIKG